tara:strand:- start:11 stop:1213 length:1203 start_codon:yes stop_codon:yes gene_type:complete
MSESSGAMSLTEEGDTPDAESDVANKVIDEDGKYNDSGSDQQEGVDTPPNNEQTEKGSSAGKNSHMLSDMLIQSMGMLMAEDKRLNKKERRYGMKKYKNCASGEEIATWLHMTYPDIDERELLRVGKELILLEYLKPLPDSSQEFVTSPNVFYLVGKKRHETMMIPNSKLEKEKGKEKEKEKKKKEKEKEKEAKKKKEEKELAEKEKKKAMKKHSTDMATSSKLDRGREKSERSESGEGELNIDGDMEENEKSMKGGTLRGRKSTADVKQLSMSQIVSIRSRGATTSDKSAKKVPESSRKPVDNKKEEKNRRGIETARMAGSESGSKKEKKKSKDEPSVKALTETIIKAFDILDPADQESVVLMLLARKKSGPMQGTLIIVLIIIVITTTTIKIHSRLEL